MNDKKGLWLNLGCGDDILDGFINIDKEFSAEDHMKHRGKLWVCNLEAAWPPLDGTVDYVLAKDIIEHLPDKIHTMNEAHRILKNGGIFEIHVPTTDGTGAFQDPTHVSFWNRRSFLYYEHGNIYRDRFAKSYGVKAAFKVVSESVMETMDGPRLTIILEAVK